MDHSKLVIFDLDGVLIDSRELHFRVLNRAIASVAGEPYAITEKEHLTKYDGLSTRQKLARLSSEKGLPATLHDAIWEDKQRRTFEELRSVVQHDSELVSVFWYLKEVLGATVVVASNSIRETIDIVVDNSGISGFVDLVLSNEDVSLPKPNPQMYLKAMAHFGISPLKTHIFEDSFIGRQAAFLSGAHVCPVKNTKELTFDYVKECVSMTSEHKKLKWVDKKMNILIPMAGEGSRFAKAGYTFPKPLIEVEGKPMIQVVVENLNIDANFIFLVRKEHDEKYSISSTLGQVAPGCSVVLVDSLTEGAACTTLLAKHLIDNDDPLLIANSDQYMDWESCEFYHSVNGTVDGAILTFQSVHPKWSYAKTDQDGNVTAVAEKVVISDLATTGVYYFARGKDYVKYAEQMISKDIRHGQSFNGRGEFYVAPVYNEAIEDGLVIKTFGVRKMWGLGTPEDLQEYLRAKDAP